MPGPRLPTEGAEADRGIDGRQHECVHPIPFVPRKPGYSRTAIAVCSSSPGAAFPTRSKNLAANPDVLLTLDDHTVPMRARTASSDERATLWPAVVAVNKSYAAYQRNTDREIPLVICEPHA